MFSTLSRLIRPIAANSVKILSTRSAAASRLAPSLSRSRPLSSTSNLWNDKKDDGNPFSIDEMIMDSSDGDLEDLNVPDPAAVEENQASKEPNLTDDEVILNLSNSEGHEGGNMFDEEIEDEEYSEYMDDDEIARQILNVALEFVPTHGWSQKSIDSAVDALELSLSTAGMFKRGAAELVIHFIESSNKKLFEILATESKRFSTDKTISTSDFIEKAIQARLSMIIPYIDSWPQALSLLASPNVVPDVFEHGANMIDEIWYHAGDMSTDMTWYSKRAAVAALHLSTELYMLQDKSADFKDTWDFLHRRMKDIESASTCKNSLEHAVQDAFNLASAGVTTAQNILGLNSKNR